MIEKKKKDSIAQFCTTRIIRGTNKSYTLRNNRSRYSFVHIRLHSVYAALVVLFILVLVSIGGVRNGVKQKKKSCTEENC